MASIVEAVLLEHVAGAEPCSRMQWAAGVLLKAKGRSRLAEVSSAAGLSARSWRRHFSTEIGVSPKRYLRMLRLRHAIVLKRLQPARSWTQIGLEAGYYDQCHEDGKGERHVSTAAHAAGFADSAHLARTSRRMIGIPPSALDIVDEE